jgi:hypothetical protein
MAEELEVHLEKRQVRRDVAVADPIRELDAVDDDRLGDEGDVLGPQVTVAVSDPPFGDAAFEDVPTELEEAELARPDRLEPGARER